MTVSIRSVLHNTQFKRADPVVEVEGKDLDTPVRWVFTNEREDVSSFLSGGEMLIIEGNALLAADWHGTLGQYVASLAQAGVAALVPDVYLEVQHPCWSCNSNSSSANASAGVR